MWPKNVLMVEPTGFDIKYAINPHMRDENGDLNSVDSNLAFKQWSALKQKFQELGLTVHTLQGSPELPDMVFCANPFFPLPAGTTTQLLLSNMNSPYRQQEPSLFAAWAAQKGLQSQSLKTTKSFEGMGDALWSYDTMEIFGGHGFRTEETVYDELEQDLKQKVIRLELTSEHFYHLDTCLCILNKDSAMYVKEAFTAEGVQTLNMRFKNLIEIPSDEAIKGFAGNACSVDGQNVLLPTNCHKTRELLENNDFTVHELDTSEFIKSGGSIFCMKMLFW